MSMIIQSCLVGDGISRNISKMQFQNNTSTRLAIWDATYFTYWFDGWKVCICEIRSIIKDMRNWVLRVRTALEPNTRGYESVTMTYGFRKIALILAACFGWIIPSIIDLKLHARMDKSIVVLNYIFVAIFALFSVISLYFLHGTFVAIMLPKINYTLGTMFDRVASFMAISYVVAAATFMGTMVIRRDRTLEFLTNHCSRILIDKRHQNMISTRVTLIIMMAANLTEPMMIQVLTSDWLNAQDFYNKLTYPIRALVKLTICINIWDLGILHLSTMYSPTFMTIFVSCSLAERIKQSIVNFVRPFSHSRINEECAHSQKDKIELRKSVGELARLLETTMIDWPTRPEAHSRSVSRAPSCTFNNAVRVQCCNYNQARTYDYCDTDVIIPIHIMQYRRLIKLLTDVRNATRAFEGIVGNMHFWALCLRTLTTAHCVMLCVLRKRVELEGNMQDGDTIIAHRTNDIILYTCIYMLMAGIIDVLTFTHLDRLPTQLNRLKIELFNMNLAMVPRDAQARVGDYHYTAHRAGMVDNAWQLYDEASRLCEEANLRMIGKSYYNKRLLLSVFGQQISCCLLYAQFVDIYLLLQETTTRVTRPV